MIENLAKEYDKKMVKERRLDGRSVNEESVKDFFKFKIDKYIVRKMI